MRIEETTVVPVPRWQAFRLAVQPENMPLWNHGVIESRALGPLERGAKVVQVSQVFGHRFQTLFEVSCFEPPRRVTFTSLEGPMEVKGTMEFTAERRGGTRVRWIVEGDCRGFLHVADGVLARVGRREMQDCLRILSELLGSRPDPQRRLLAPPQRQPTGSVPAKGLLGHRQGPPVAPGIRLVRSPLARSVPPGSEWPRTAR